MGTEVLLLFLVRYLECPLNESTETVYAIISRIICFCMVKIVLLVVKKKRNVELDFQDWLEVFVVPVGSIWILLTLVKAEPFSEQASCFVASAIVLLINIVTYYLYERSKEAEEKRIREKVLEKQCEYYIRQNKESQKWWEELRNFRHDIKQRYLLEKMLVDSGKYSELERYCNENLKLITRGNLVSNTGNIYIDSIINYKAEYAAQIGIEFEVKENIPRDGEMNAEDICICLGNLLDNAIEELAGHKEKGKYLTHKADSGNHGLGLIIVGQIAEKYKGQVEIHDENDRFDVAVLLYDFIH